MLLEPLAVEPIISALSISKIVAEVVGNNGSPGIIDYAEGFADAAMVLLDQVLAHRFSYSTDTFIYPICFNMRHAAELYLKAAIQLLHSLGGRSRGLPPFDMDGSHDIGRIWAYFRDHAPSIDRRYQSVVDGLDDSIGDIAAVDPNGQVFRYPFGRENNKHLEEIEVINCRLLKERFAEIRAKLSELGRLSAELAYEYSLGTYTAHLSRLDVFCIAGMLPPRAEWGTAAFDEAKARIRNLFAISSNEFSRAVCLVKGNREMATLIASPIPLDHCDSEQFFAFFDAWFGLNDREEVFGWLTKDPNDMSRSPETETQDLLASIEGDAKARAEAWASVSKNLSLEAIGEIEALYTFYKTSNMYGEEFDRERVAITGHLTRKLQVGEANYGDSVMNFMEKLPVMQGVLDALNFFGHNELVRLLLDRYQLSNHAARLLEDSNWRVENRVARIQEHLRVWGGGELSGRVPV